MSFDIQKSDNSIQLGTSVFNISSYSITHSDNIIINSTVNGNVLLHSQGAKPFILTLEGKFLNDSKIAIMLENSIASKIKYSFTIDDMQFNNILIMKYKYHKTNKASLNPCEIIFIGNGFIIEKEVAK